MYMENNWIELILLRVYEIRYNENAKKPVTSDPCLRSHYGIFLWVSPNNGQPLFMNSFLSSK